MSNPTGVSPHRLAHRQLLTQHWTSGPEDSEPCLTMVESGTSSPMLRWFRRNMGFGRGTGSNGGANAANGSVPKAPVDDDADEETPLLATDAGGTSNNNDGAGGIMLLPSYDAALKETIVAATALLCFVASCASVLIDLATSNRSVLLSGILGCLLSPYAVMQQKKLTQIEALEQSNEQMEVEIAELSKENARLAASVQQLEESVQDLPAMEEALGTLQSVHGRSLPQLQEELEKYHARFASRSDSIDDDDVHSVTRIRGEAIQLLVKAADVGGGRGVDQAGATALTTPVMLSDAEIDALVSDLDRVRGLRVNPVLFRDCVVEHGRAVRGLIHIVRHLLRTKVSSTTTDEPQLFRITSTV